MRGTISVRNFKLQFDAKFLKCELRMHIQNENLICLDIKTYLYKRTFGTDVVSVVGHA